MQSAHAKGGRALVDADQAAPDQRLQSGRGKIFTAQLRERQLAAAGRQLGQNRLLLGGEGGQARFGDQDGEALGAAGIALGGGCFAGDPFFAGEAGQDRQRGGGGSAQRGDLYRVAGGQAREDAPLHILLFGAELAFAPGTGLFIPTLV